MNAAGLLPHQRAEKAPVIAAPNPEETLPEEARPPVAKVEVRSPVASASGTTNVDSVVEKAVPQKTAANSPAPEGKEPQVRESVPRLEHQESARFFAAAPQRRPEEIIRITIAPWTDSDGDLHEGHRLYMRVREASPLRLNRLFPPNPRLPGMRKVARFLPALQPRPTRSGRSGTPTPKSSPGFFPRGAIPDDGPEIRPFRRQTPDGYRP